MAEQPPAPTPKPKKKGFWQKVGAFFADAAEWVQETFADPVVSAAIREDLGLDADGQPLVTLPEERMAGIRAYVARDDPDHLAFADLVSDIAVVVEALMDAISVIEDSDPDRGQEELLYQFVRMFAVEHVRVRVPLVYALAKVSTVISDQFGAVEDLDLDRLLALVFGPDVDDDDDGDATDRPALSAEEATRYSNLLSFAVLATELIFPSWFEFGAQFETMYGWDPAPDTPTPVADAISERTWTWLLRPAPDVPVAAMLTFALVPDDHGGPGIVIALGGQLGFDHVDEDPETGRTTTYRFSSATAGALTAFIPFSEAAEPFRIEAGSDAAQVFRLDVVPGGIDGPALVIGDADGTRLEIGSHAVGIELGLGRVGARFAFRDVELIVELGDGDGFLRSLPGDDLRFGFDLVVVVDSERGLRIEGGSGLRVTLPVARTVLGLTVHAVELALTPSPDRDVLLAVTTSLSFRVGPVTLSLDRIGFTLDTTLGTGNLGVLDVDAGFRAPTGVGLSVDAGVLKGGGFLSVDRERHEYAGVFDLTLDLDCAKVAVKVVGILTTELPGGAPGWSLLLVVFSEFTINLPFNLTLLGVGGVVGIQHGLALPVLHQGVRTKLLDDLLFPADPVADAPRLLNRLREVYPITPRALVIGPFLKLGYGRPPLARLTLGLILQYDDVFETDADATLTRLAIVAQVTVEVPPKEVRGAAKPAVKLVADAIGSYDWPSRTLAIDLRLRDSTIGGMTIAGSLVVRASYGDDATYIMAAGGFHPEFKALPKGLPKQDRLALGFTKGIAKITLQLYVAKTSNTIQGGFAILLVAKKWGFTLEAKAGFDLLYETEPECRFTADLFLAGVIKKGSRTLLSLDAKLRLQGPGHWYAAGKAKFKVLFISKTLSFCEEWGDPAPVTRPEIDVGSLIRAALADPDAWATALPRGTERYATLVDRVPPTGPLVHPLGRLEVTQRIAPLRLDLDRIGSGRPVGERRFAITEVRVGGQPATTADVTEHFARAHYLDLSEDDKLTADSFEDLPAGVAVGAHDVQVPPVNVAAAADHEVRYIPEPKPPQRVTVPPLVLVAHLRGATGGDLGRPRFHAPGRARRVRVTEPVVTLARRDDLKPVAGVVGSFSQVAQAAAAHPGTQVVEEHELPTAGGSPA